MPPKIVVLCGPTATGKTRLGVALARALNGEVVSADSMQVYRRMQIGTARPTWEEQQGVPHHMLAVAEPEEAYSVARYVEEATACVEDILARGKLPLVVGGTGLYIDALCAGRSFSDFRPESGCRAWLKKRAGQEGLAALVRQLREVDPESAERLHPNDEKRILRALEVWYETGQTISEHNRKTRAIPPRYEAATLALTYEDRAVLYERIDQRVDAMMAQGLLEEVRALLASGIPADCTAMQAIGYKELTEVALGFKPLAPAVALVKQRSRQYAKRQLTWFRRKEQAHWIQWQAFPDFSKALQDSTNFLHGIGLV